MHIVPISAHILDGVCKLRFIKSNNKGMHITQEDVTSYTPQYQEAFLMYVEIKHCTIHRYLTVIKPKCVPMNNRCTSAMFWTAGESSFATYGLPSDDEEYSMPNSVSYTMPRQSNHAVHQPTAKGLVWIHHLNKHRIGGKLIWIILITTPTLGCLARKFGYRISLTGGVSKRKCTHHREISPMWTHDILSIIPPGVGVEARFSLQRDVISWWRSKTTGKKLRNTVSLRMFVWANI
jgi:hypothetical protein